MNCKDCLAVIEEYVDAELDQRTANRVATHVGGCAECARKYEELKDEQQVYALYRRELEVTPALWRGVQARIEQERSGQAAMPRKSLRERFAGAFGVPRLSPALTVALVVLAIGITVAVMKFVNSQAGPDATQVVSQTGANNPPSSKSVATPETTKGVQDSSVSNAGKADADRAQGVDQREEKNIVIPVAERTEAKRALQKPGAAVREPSPDQLVREAEQKYLAAITILSRDVNRRRSRLDPEVVARFDQTLAAIDRSIIETRRAVRAQPDDPVAVQYMLTAYAKKVEVLKEIASY
jgi:anti-sigma factor RsiW